MIIAIDGPAASGKGTLAKRLARHLGLPHLDTGLLYRAVALALAEQDVPAHDAAAAERAAQALDAARLPPEEALRRADLGEGASVVSAHPGVRRALVDAQRRFAATPGGAVLDGRDIGTVICPDADVKVFVTAQPHVRAERRLADLLPRHPELTLAEVLHDLLRRDERDSSRPDAPLRQAEDAILVDTTLGTPEEVLAQVLARIGHVRRTAA